MPKNYDVIIVGCGVAGMSAALNLLRSGLSVLIIENDSIGGQIAKSPKVENYPSIKSISGVELSMNIYEQIDSLGCEFEFEEVISVTKEDLFKVTTDYQTYYSKSVIFATGVKHRILDKDNDLKYIGKGVSYCAICDGAFYENKDVIVIGDGNSAMQYALMLSNTSNKVYLCTLFDKFFGEKIYEKRLKETENIEIIHNVSFKSYIGDDQIEGAIFNAGEKELKISASAIFIAIGNIPNNDRFINLVNLDANGYIETDEKLMTKTPGVFAIGDCRSKDVRQVSTAISDGSICAFFCYDYINNKNED